MTLWSGMHALLHQDAQDMGALYSPTSSPCLLHRGRASTQTAFRLAIPGAAQPNSCFLRHL